MRDVNMPILKRERGERLEPPTAKETTETVYSQKLLTRFSSCQARYLFSNPRYSIKVPITELPRTKIE